MGRPLISVPSGAFWLAVVVLGLIPATAGVSRGGAAQGDKGRNDKGDGASTASGMPQQGILPEPGAQLLHPQDFRREGATADSEDVDDSTGDPNQLRARIAAMEVKANECAKRAEAAQHATRLKLQSITLIEGSLEEKDRQIAQLQADHVHFRERAEWAEAAVDELQKKLVADNVRLTELESRNADLASVKAVLEGKLQKLERENSALLRRESVERQTLHRSMQDYCASQDVNSDGGQKQDSTGATGFTMPSWVLEKWGLAVTYADREFVRAKLLGSDAIAVGRQAASYMLGSYWRSVEKAAMAFSLRAEKDLHSFQQWLRPVYIVFVKLKVQLAQHLKQPGGLESQQTYWSPERSIAALITGIVGMSTAYLILHGKGRFSWKRKSHALIAERSGHEKKDSASDSSASSRQESKQAKTVENRPQNRRPDMATRRRQKPEQQQAASGAELKCPDKQ